MQVLLAEHESTSRLVLKANLKNVDREVMVVSKGREAWDFLRQK